MAKQTIKPANNPGALVTRIEELEIELARARLLLTSLAELCLVKGVFTIEELRAMAKRIDRTDGREDGSFTRKKKRSI